MKYLVVVVSIPNDAILKNVVMIWEADQQYYLGIYIRECRWDEDLLELAGRNGRKEYHTWLHHITHLLSKAWDRSVCSFLL